MKKDKRMKCALAGALLAISLAGCTATDSVPEPTEKAGTETPSNAEKMTPKEAEANAAETTAEANGNEETAVESKSGTAESAEAVGENTQDGTESVADESSGTATEANKEEDVSTESPSESVASEDGTVESRAPSTDSVEAAAPSERLRKAFENHDQNTDSITRLNINAPEQSYSYWGTGLTSEEEKEMILSMNEHFKKAVLKKSLEKTKPYSYGPNETIFPDGGKQYIYEGNWYQLLLDAAEGGAISREDAELCILADTLWTDRLYGELSEQLKPKVFAWLRDSHSDKLKPYDPYEPMMSVDSYSRFAAMSGASSSAAKNSFATMEEAVLDEDVLVDVAEEVLPMMGYEQEDSEDSMNGDVEAGGMETEEEYFNTSEYNVIKENGFHSVSASPLSTFSIDVDTAGYTKVKYDILQGREIPKDEVKIEELINYFNFDYTADRIGNDPFIISTQFTSCPWNNEHQLLRIGIRADDLQDKPDTNFVMVADVSGSMLSLNKLPLALNAYADMLEGLDGSDKVSLMYYADSDGVILDGVACDEKDKIYEGLADTLFSAGGGTYGEAGLNTAYSMAKESFIENGVNRVLIATDGDFNIGRTSSSDMKDIVEAGRKEGIYLTILGYGFENLKDNKMETMAENGHGNYHYIGDVADARKALVEEAASTLIPVADDVKIQVEFNPENVQEYRLIGYESRLLQAEDFNNDKVNASEIGAGKSVTALYEIVPVGAGAETSTEKLKYTSIQSNGGDDICTVAVRCKPINSSITGAASERIEKAVSKDEYVEIPDDSTALAISLAEFGMVLRDSEFRGTACLSSALAIAEAVAEDTRDPLAVSYAELLATLKENSAE